jgi:diadenosine tetraphosphate (Ap4A) HIT family hydrolase
MFKSQSCLLCDELDGERALSARLGLYASAHQKILLQCENFVLIPDIAPLVPGHALIVSKHHVACYAALENEFAEEFEGFKDRVVAHYKSRVGRAALFEHGSFTSLIRSGACVQHAHVHVLPLELPLSSWSEAHGTVRHYSNTFSRAGILGAISEDYLAFETTQGSGGVSTGLNSALPCQYLRRRVALHLNLKDWDWTQVLFEPSTIYNLIPPELEIP